MPDKKDDKKPAVKVQDLSPKKDAKGGARITDSRTADSRAADSRAADSRTADSRTADGGSLY